MNLLRHCVAGLSIVAAGLLVSCATYTESRDPRAIELFNGHDLTNWTATLAKPGVKKEQVWSIQREIIVCKGEPMGYIESAQKFTNFHLSVEWRWAPGKPPGNSGIFLRINGEPKPLPRCIECQLKSGDAGDMYGFHDLVIGGEPLRIKKIPNHELGGNLIGLKKMRFNENPPGEWNQAEIYADGPNITIWINGRKVNDATNCDVIGGSIGLQSEGGEVHFRNVRIVPL